jgi:hypothetical protein
MPRKDTIHEAVKTALIRDGWTITDDPYNIEYAGMTLFADLGAERVLAAERGTERIAVEIKSFLARSAIHDFQAALGQYRMYRDYMEETDPERKLYLALSQAVYEESFSREAFQFIVQRENLPLIVVAISAEEVIEWIN